MPLMKHTLSRCSALIAVGFLVLSQAVLGDVSSTWAAAGENPHLMVTLERLTWAAPE